MGKNKRKAFDIPCTKAIAYDSNGQQAGYPVEKVYDANGFHTGYRRING